MNYLSALSLLSLIISLSGAAVPNLKFYDETPVPILGFGTWQITGTAANQAVKDALDVGYRHIDTANMYRNEKEVGDAIKSKIAEGIIKREDIFITTKLLPDTTGYKHANDSIYNSLTQLQVSSIDLLLIHWPQGDYVNAYKALEDAHTAGLVKSIGVSNFGQKELDNLLKTAKVKPVMNQIESHPKKVQQATIDYSEKLGIVVTAWSPLGSGNLLNDTTIINIGKKHNKSAAQVLIRFQIQKNVVVIPKSTKIEHMKENFNVFDFTLTDDEMKTLQDLH